MPKPEIIGSARSTYTWAVRMVCEEKGIDYVLTETPLRAPELLAIHPFGKMPVLRHGDVELFESKAIATYLDRSFPAPWLFPSDPRLAGLTEQWVSLVQHGDRPHPDPDLCVGLYRPQDVRWNAGPRGDRCGDAGGARTVGSSR